MGFVSRTPIAAEITMSIAGLMQPMFLRWLHRSNGPMNKNPVPKGIFSLLIALPAFAYMRKTVARVSSGHGHRFNSNILRPVS
jgi:hypothetical protein